MSGAPTTTRWRARGRCPSPGRYRPGVKLATLLALTLCAAACSTTSTAPSEDPGGFVTVVRVLDGDSLIVDIDGAETQVRLRGINTPERDECFDQEAKERTTRLAAVRIRLAGEGHDQFGRLLRYAFAEDGTLINQQLVVDGFALALSTDHPRLSEFKAAENAAFEAGTGRWQAEACGPARPVGIAISGLEPNAPGDDAQNLNGEWVELTNRGTGAARLQGWTLHDESSSHRFTFPEDLTILPDDKLRIFSGCGTRTADALYWCDGNPIWTNGGDTAYLLDGSGNAVDRFPF